MKLRRIYFYILILCAFFNQYNAVAGPGKLRRMIRKSSILKSQHTGFALYNIGDKKWLKGYQDDKYFQPASNTKLYTFYGGLCILKDSVPALKYIIRNDSLIFWGTGDPSLLNRAYKTEEVFNFLKSTKQKLFFADGQYTGKKFGPGWAWDDYNDDYQSEINEFPLYGNGVWFNAGTDGRISMVPDMFSLIKTNKKGPFEIRRDVDQNVFFYPRDTTGYKQFVPFETDEAEIACLLQDTLKRAVGFLHEPIPQNVKAINSLPADSLYKYMLHVSDNFTAEQLHLVYAARLGIEMNTAQTIAYIIKNYLPDLPDKPSWVDGSGLSRYNLFTPRDNVKLLEKIYEKVNDQSRLFALLPNGGKSGTLKNYFKSEIPYVFAKTGSFSNNYNLAGYLVSKRGKIYAFSFMNNNFTLPSNQIRQEVERILSYLHTHG
ncbi:hypothetical protein GS399_02090 [Pedobacter sp. HMF7647]|uniref:Peptidase S13 n=1 Tax=Hufsiella arboris TaxID=2695275 RepID=A0A7K1Y585_9SPHI|nr:D-alanyl-D-alanine carboxypeptidase [Hufsiella arboris]MXV49745.1 hypothetical protein [Hufsiella arboris]